MTAQRRRPEIGPAPAETGRLPSARVVGLVLLALVVVALFGGRLLQVTGYLLARTVTAQAGVLEVAVTMDAMLLRDETIVTSPMDGRVTRLVDEGARVPRDGVVAEVVSNQAASRPAGSRESMVLRSGRAGLVSFRMDGWEGSVPLGRALDTDLQALRAAGAGAGEVVDGDQVTLGGPLYRIVDNNRVFVAGTAGEAPGLTIGQRVTVVFQSLPDEDMPGVIRDLRVSRDGLALLIAVERYVPSFTSLRWDEVRVVLRRYRGVILPTSAITQVRSRTGVYVRGDSGPIFKEVTVRGEVAGQVAVDGVAPQTRVVVNPARLIGSR